MQAVRRARRAQWALPGRVACASSVLLARSLTAQQCHVSCAAGFAGSDGTCAMCADGTEPNEDMTACQPCAAGWAGTGGVCSQCAAGSEPTADQRACQDCAVGYAGSDGTCARCPAGTGDHDSVWLHTV